MQVNVPAKSELLRSTSEKELQRQMELPNQTSGGRDRSFSLDSASRELLTKCSKGLTVDSDPGGRGLSMEPIQGSSDHLSRPDGDDDAAPGEADDVLSPQVCIVPLMRVYSLSLSLSLTRVPALQRPPSKEAARLLRHEPPARARHAPKSHLVQPTPSPTSCSHLLRDPSPTYLSLLRQRARRREQSKFRRLRGGTLGWQAAPTRKERLDPFDFVGRRKHVSCSLEDFEAMRVRPACASPTKEDSFCLCDDRGAAATNKFLLQNLLVSRRPLSLSHDDTQFRRLRQTWRLST